MHTFLAFPDFIHSAKVLDDNTLHKQFIDCIAIIYNMKYEKISRKQHPVFQMWCGYEKALKMYTNIVMFECDKRGLENNITFYIVKQNEVIYPNWIKDERLHKSHRAGLINIDPEYYGKLWPEVDRNAPYWWPCKLKDQKDQKTMEDYWNAVC